MLGHTLCKRLAPRFDVFAAARMPYATVQEFPLFQKDRYIEGLDVRDLNSVRRVLACARPEVVVNAVGIVKQSPEATDMTSMIYANALFPHTLGDLCDDVGARLIHISTDCVFSGRVGGYSEADEPDPVDTYGMTKLLGEVRSHNSLVLRTSMIGTELFTRRGLLEWFLEQARAGTPVRGFEKAIFSGLTTLVLADVLEQVLARWQDLKGTYHVSADPIDKYSLLILIRDHFHVQADIVADDSVHVDRSLDSTLFRSVTGWLPPSWDEMIFGLVHPD
jgi:dTDP-4-dehydrorhamnose reductase